ncbi:MAG: cell division protein ZapA [Rhizobiales bacterium]|nr:cell division protein ZapA [Hyphomicrobiales bacterium]
MPHVNVTIDGKPYRMACEDGQEDYLQNLAKDLDRRITDLRGRFTDITESRLLVMAALMLSDELSEKTRLLAESPSARLDVGVAGPDRARATQNAIAAALDAASERIERVTKDLNRSIGENVPMG